MIQLKDISWSAGGRTVLSHITGTVSPGVKTALVGANGAGKTTLLRIICGELAAESGDVTIPAGLRIGYLPQEERSVEAGDILSIVISGNRQAVALERELYDISRRLADDGPGQEKLLKRLGTLEETYRATGGYETEHHARAVLSGLGFAESSFHKPVAQLSGGWRMRVYLARILVNKPDILLLDEPTNHLDLPSLEWLEQYLQSFPGTTIAVSHDRYFIDRLTTEILELEHAALTRYVGGFRAYEEQKRSRLEMLREKAEQLRLEREKTERWIERFRYKATKAAQVQSRIKALEKMEKIELPPGPATLGFRLQAGPPSYKEVFSAESVSFTYGGDWVVQEIDLRIYRGDRIALVGANGAGKTTLTRLITGTVRPQQGRLDIGRNVTFGYYAQHQIDSLDPRSTVLGHVARTSGLAEKTVRSLLGVFHFSGDDVYKPIQVLSGGEKARVTLAGILAVPCNFLIMDEPTNHLDLTSRQALEQALSTYDGTLLLISHDRYFLDSLVTRIIEVGEKTIRVYEGNYSEFLQKKEGEASPAVPSRPPAAGREAGGSRDRKRLAAEIRQRASSRRRELEEALRACEHEIGRCERAVAELEQSLSAPGLYADPDRAVSLNKQYAAEKSRLDPLYQRWEGLQHDLDALLRSIEDEIAALAPETRK
ncbi:ABC-F family ATP-binding cassette domain-containing protein [bacterium]|nr:ABC-F family ATP-binding cassette domain-containing protein [bacterium]